MLTLALIVAVMFDAATADIRPSLTLRHAAPPPASCADIIPRETLRFTGIGGAQRHLSELSFQMGRPNELLYDEQWRTDTVTAHLSGVTTFGTSGTPIAARVVRSDNDRRRLDESVEQRADSIVTVRNGVRSSRVTTGVGVPVPRARPFPLVVVLSTCALRQPQRQLELDSAGTLRLTEAARLTLRQNDRDVQLTLYQVSSTTAGPLGRLWFDEKDSFFASADDDGPTDIVVRSGWENSADDLIVAEARSATPRMKASAARLVEQIPSAGIVFTHARVIDVERGIAHRDASVYVRGSRIVEVSTDPDFPTPTGAREFDLAGKTILPGLWDMGQAFGQRGRGATSDLVARTALAQGVTSGRDLNTDTLVSPLIAQRIGTGDQIGPTLYGSCFMDGWLPDSIGGVVPPERLLIAPGRVRDSTDVRRMLAACGRVGFRYITLYPLMPRDLSAFAAAQAHRTGMRVTGDALRGATVSDLLSIGYDELGHIGQALMPLVQLRDSAFADWALGTIGGGRSFVTKGAALANLDLASPAVAALVQTLKSHGTAIASSYCVYETIGRQGDSTTSARALDTFKRFGALLHKAGIPMLVATDDACPITHELRHLRDVGYTNAELLRMSTIDAARSARVDRTVGTIARGKTADLFICDCDPLADVTQLDHVTAVMKGGALYTKLSELRQREPFLPR